MAGVQDIFCNRALISIFFLIPDEQIGKPPEYIYIRRFFRQFENQQIDRGMAA